MKELLSLLCLYPFDEKNREALSDLLGKVLDWHEMTDLINAHGIIALAAYNIKEAGLKKEIPEDVMTILENGYMQSIVRNTWFTERWKEVNTILCNAGIKHILLKGMALEHTIYGARGLRQMTDNDILVKPEDAVKAWQLLQKEGFSYELIKSDLYKKILTDIGKHLPTLCKNGYAIDIHHKLFDTKSEETETRTDPFEDAIEIVVGDTKAWILSKELHNKYLIKHFEKHALEGNCQLRLYTDILMLDESSSLSMPDSFISNPKQEMTREQRKAAYRANFSNVPLKHWLRFIIGDIFPSVEWMKKRYKCNGFKVLLYYPHRIGKLIWLI